MNERKEYFKEYYRKNKEKIRIKSKINYTKNKKYVEDMLNKNTDVLQIMFNNLKRDVEEMLNKLKEELKINIVNKKIKSESKIINNSTKTVNNSSNEQKRITLQIDNDLLLEIEKTKKVFTHFFIETLLQYQTNEWKLEEYEINNKMRKDIIIKEEIHKIYRELPDVNKMKYINYLLKKAIEIYHGK